ncbi:FAD-linked oxidase C-terminal domain-containing protein [Virgibacillus sp. 179-BFC.A HS]|uniref:FAD-linked oxidase C-terminal domain-containing protein n=1 Tax=Tigheibacillus jepli TaxID=3035914 RepID=A0ABU5CFL3_9BACI|nr:FAD-linked oxidase C-terminal domain-containing protein [Virgibacillus sp. 179-BFC.A HS]MDY0404786.1 FAD-linked oxidase C-terminal domain-containing protein [Virgibacillus sp. 179-BFC.A HS]
MTALMQFTEYEMLDEVVPINKFAEMISYTKELQQKHELKVINFGHAGDGNIHTVLMKKDLDEETWKKSVKPIWMTSMKRYWSLVENHLQNME